MTDHVDKSDRVVFRVTFRDLEHFHKVIKWLNKHVGKGAKNWTIPKKIRRALEQEGKPVTKNVHVFKKDFDGEETAMYLNLI